MRWEYRVCDVPIGWNTSTPGEARELILVEMYYGALVGRDADGDTAESSDRSDGKERFLGWADALGPAGDSLDDFLADVEAMRRAAAQPIVRYEDLQAMTAQTRGPR